MKAIWEFLFSGDEGFHCGSRGWQRRYAAGTCGDADRRRQLLLSLASGFLRGGPWRFLPPFPCPGYGAGNDGRHFPIIMRAAVFRVPAPAEKKLHSGGRPARLREGICVLGRDRAPPPRHTSRPCCTGRPLRPAGACPLNHLTPGRLGWGAATRGRPWLFSRSGAEAYLL